jgi:hypothetical protein
MLYWVMTLDGVIGSMEFGAWVSKRDAVETLRGQYPEALAILDTKDNSLVWASEGVELA